MKRLISYITVLALVLVLIPSAAFAAEQASTNGLITWDGDAATGNEVAAAASIEFFLNGNASTITANAAGGIKITATNGTLTDEIIYLGDNADIFGGSKAAAVTSTDVTLEGGTVSRIFGGGSSTDSASPASVNTTNVKLNGGTVVNSVYGGGSVFSSVNTSNVSLNGATVKDISGGGRGSAPYASTSAIDQNTTGTANTTINSGTVTSCLFGGGQGLNTVDNANVVINGGDAGQWVTAGGSNGKTSNASVIINDGEVGVFQSTNRGTVENADVTVNGGTVENFYVGGENDPNVSGTIGSVNVNIAGGTVENLAAGTNGGPANPVVTTGDSPVDVALQVSTEATVTPDETINNPDLGVTLEVYVPTLYFQIDIVTGKGGYANPETPTFAAENGNSVPITFKAKEGYTLINVVVDGVSMGAITEYTFKNVIANHKIEAVFADNSVTPPQTGAASLIGLAVMSILGAAGCFVAGRKNK